MAFLAVLFALSGAAGLMYEVVWTRALADATGSTTVAMASVFAVFLAALALGAWFFGRTARWGRRAVVFYGVLEILVGVTAGIVSAVMLTGGEWIGSLAPGGTTGTIGYAVLVSVALIGPPTFLMGGTLPILINGIAGWVDPRRHVARFYAWNTLGAAVGTLLAGMLLIRLAGLSGTVAVAVMVNLGVGGVILVLHRRFLPDESREYRRPAEAVERQADDASPPKDMGLWNVLAFASGALVLAYEILWGRIARFLVGDRTISVTLVLFTAITALGVGSFIVTRLSDRIGPSRRAQAPALVGLVFAAASIVHLLVVPIALDFASRVILPGALLRFTFLCVLMAPPILILGLAFPLLLWSAEEVSRRPGRTVGRLYLINAGGAVAGSIAGAFLLARWLGTVGAFKLLGVLSAAGAIPLILMRPPGGLPRGSRLAVAVAVVAAIVWPAAPGSLVQVRPGEELVEAREDEYGVQTLLRSQRGTLRVRNNRVSLVYDLGDTGTMYAQQMAGHMAALLATRLENVVNVGTGYGITAGTFTLYDEVERVATIELLPFMVEKQDDVFAPWNFGYTNDPRVELVQADGRRWLTRSDELWDVISVNVLDPYLPGSSSLYTVDFWKLARERLAPGGVYTQLFWGADVDLLLRGMTAAFPTVLLFPVYGGTSWTVIAFRDETSLDELQPRVGRLSPRALRAFQEVTGYPPDDILPALIQGARQQTRSLMARAEASTGPLHTDDRPILEFRWMHGVDDVSIFDSPLIRY